MSEQRWSLRPDGLYDGPMAEWVEVVPLADNERLREDKKQLRAQVKNLRGEKGWLRAEVERLREDRDAAVNARDHASSDAYERGFRAGRESREGG